MISLFPVCRYVCMYVRPISRTLTFSLCCVFVKLCPLGLLLPTSGLERRLKSRVPREKGKGVPEGRTNLKPSEEDFWHEAGVYDYSSDASTRRPSPEVASRQPACGERHFGCFDVRLFRRSSCQLFVCVRLSTFSDCPMTRMYPCSICSESVIRLSMVPSFERPVGCLTEPFVRSYRSLRVHSPVHSMQNASMHFFHLT